MNGQAHAIMGLENYVAIPAISICDYGIIWQSIWYILKTKWRMATIVIVPEFYAVKSVKTVLCC